MFVYNRKRNVPFVSNSTKSFPGQIRLCKPVFYIKFDYVLDASKRIRIYISFMKDHNKTDFEL